MKRPSVSGAILISFYLTLTALAQTQSYKSRVVEKAAGEGPVEIVDLSIEGRTANVLDPVGANKDWLKSLSLNVKNIHSKPVVHIEIEIEVAKTGNMKHPLRLPIIYGHRPSGPEETRRRQASEKLAHGKTLQLSISDDTYKFLVNFMSENQIEDIDKVKIFVEFVVFDDDTAWGKGHVMHRNANRLDEWVVVGLWQKERALSRKRNSEAPAHP